MSKLYFILRINDCLEDVLIKSINKFTPNSEIYIFDNSDKEPFTYRQKNIVYLDKNSKHMYELNNKIRLINASEYPISSEDEFVGFVCGIVSQDHDLEQVYLASFMDVAYIKDRTLVENVVKKLDRISDQFKVDFIISVSLDASELSEYMQSKVIVSL